MQPTKVLQRLCSLVFAQCILAACVQTAPAINEKLLRELQKRQLEEDSTQSTSEQTTVVHDYSKILQMNRESWRQKNCDVTLNCGPISKQHCNREQIGRMFRHEACEFLLCNPK